MSTGVVTIGLPRIAEDLALPQNLLLWPASVYPLASGCLLVLSGCLADFLGNRSINLVGCLLLSLSTLAVGLSRNGIEVILFRAFQGIAVSLCLPTAFSILTSTFAPGRVRNIGFSCLGLGQPLGFSVGLVLGGTVIDSSLTWRFAMYLTAGLVFGLFLAGLWKLPRDKPKEPFSWPRLAREIDWMGALIISCALGLASYVFAVITADTAEIRAPLNIGLIVLAGVLVASFGFWMHYQEKSGRMPLIPNSLWSNAAFTTICIMVLLAWAVMNSLEFFFSLFFQEVQHLTALEAAIRFLPNIVLGVALNFATGMLVHKIRADYLVLITTFLSAASPLLMAVIDPGWSFWYCAFWAVLASPLSADVIFTVANLIITDAFSPKTQALAGAVFNTVAQFGVSLGLMLMAIISSSVTMKSSNPEKASPDALMDGYRAVFWACFAMMVLACVVGVFGLRRVGKVGLKRE
ncbi:putative transporter [Thozetella sp. PMI_491]|nr:putative transporter [Thozetella sp. PMI_491]